MAYSDAIVVMQIQRKLQLQIENQGKRLQVMFEKQREMEDCKHKTSSPSSLDRPTVLTSPTIEGQETLNEDQEKSGIGNINATTMGEECSEDACTNQEVEETKVINEEEVGHDQLDAPASKRVKSR